MHIELPKKYIFIYNGKLLERIRRKYKPKTIKWFGSGDTIYWWKDIGIVKVQGLGSPNACITLEELIAVGGKKFINIGTAGGLQNEGFFLCEKAIRDEGTSYHYIPHGHFSFTDPTLTKKLGKCMNEAGLTYEKGITWTVDAPYRETKAEVALYKKQKISTVEMEASALFAVAKVRKVKIASAFVVSDVLGKKWVPKFGHVNVKRGLDKLFEAALYALSD